MSLWDGTYFEGTYWRALYWGRAFRSADAPPCAQVLEDGGVGTGPDPHGHDYPFVTPSDDIRGLLADLWLSHVPTAAVPLQLVSIFGLDRAVNCGVPGPPSSGFTPQHNVDLRIADAHGTLIFDSTAASWYHEEQYSDRLRYYEWRSDTACCAVVQHTAYPDADSVRLLPAYITPARGTLDERCSLRWPKRMSSLGVRGATLRVVGGGQLEGGYNIALAAVPFQQGLRRGTAITIAATPGAGAGRYQDCGTTPNYLRSVNHQPGGGGNLELATKDCYWVRPVTTLGAGTATRTPGVLQLGNDCTPCCDCDDYVKVQRAVLAEWADYEALAATGQAIVARFKDNIERWNANKACRDANVMSLNVMANGGRLEIGASICNNNPHCLHNVVLTVDYPIDIPGAAWHIPLPLMAADKGPGWRGSGPPAVSPFANETLVYGIVIIDGSPRTVVIGGRLTYHWDLIPPMTSVMFRFRLDLALGPATTFVFTATATADGVPLPGSVVRTIVADWSTVA